MPFSTNDQAVISNCPECSGQRYFFSSAKAAYQNEGLGRRFIHQYKYEQKEYILPTLGALFYPLLEAEIARCAEDTVVVSVPLHWRRLRKRRFNQSDELARYCLKRLPKELKKRVQLSSVLKRIRHTDGQARLTRSERLVNLKNAFAWRGKRKVVIEGKRVILIDDVFTTGATLNACAEVLQGGQPAKIEVLTLLRSC